jgi:hypothetical protein
MGFVGDALKWVGKNVLPTVAKIGTSLIPGPIDDFVVDVITGQIAGGKPGQYDQAGVDAYNKRYGGGGGGGDGGGGGGGFPWETILKGAAVGVPGAFLMKELLGSTGKSNKIIDDLIAQNAPIRSSTASGIQGLLDRPVLGPPNMAQFANRSNPFRQNYPTGGFFPPPGQGMAPPGGGAAVGGMGGLLGQLLGGGAPGGPMSQIAPPLAGRQPPPAGGGGISEFGGGRGDALLDMLRRPR